jgi:hypothetical protein
VRSLLVLQDAYLAILCLDDAFFHPQAAGGAQVPTIERRVRPQRSVRELTRGELAAELRRLRSFQDGNLRDDALFVLWFLLAYASDDSYAPSRASLTGASGDKGLDAVYIDDDRRLVILVQGKYRSGVMQHAESYAEIDRFMEFAPLIWSTGSAFAAFRNSGVDALTLALLQRARQRLKERKGYRLQMCFVSLGRFTAGQLRSATVRATRATGPTEVRFFDGAKTLNLLKNYLDGVSHVPDIELSVQSGARGLVSRRDRGIESWTFSISGETLVRAYRKAGDQIFARNIRGWQGETEINEDIAATAIHKAHYFWYFNNGVTFVCDDAQMTGRAGSERLMLTNPQIINGQQTTRMLSEVAGRAAARHALRDTSVLVRVIRVPPGGPAGAMTFDELVSKIVAASNRQNRIDPSDLMSNDRIQIFIQRELRRLGFEYLRKRQKKREARRIAGIQRAKAITKFELAQAVAGCELESLPLRVGREPLFSHYYDQIFGEENIEFYLSRYLLFDAVKGALRGRGDRRYGRWLVLYAMWSDIGRKLERDATRLKGLILGTEDHRTTIRNLHRMTTAMADSAFSFYVANRGSGAARLAADSFFKREYVDDRRRVRLYRAFQTFWRGRANSRRRVTYARALNAFGQSVKVRTSRVRAGARPTARAA